MLIITAFMDYSDLNPKFAILNSLSFLHCNENFYGKLKPINEVWASLGKDW